jgi:hypothetical protein
MAAYRFFGNDDITWEAILTPHWSCSRRRIAQHKVVLMLQDTTELDFNRQSISGLGPLSYEAQRGLYVHPTYAVSFDREPLGVLDAWMWARDAKNADGRRPETKESTRWIEGYERVAELATKLPATRLVYVADRESDMIELMARASEMGQPTDWLLRAQHDRTLPDGQKLWQTMTSDERLEESPSRYPRGRAKTPVRYVSSFGRVLSIFLMARSSRSGPPVWWPRKSIHLPAVARSSGAC